ncbi:MAG: hypothetical protein SGCHY_001055 [Lobulomycetales sp.]
MLAPSLDDVVTEADRDPATIFDVKEKLGQGAFGSVYKCTLKHTALDFALKVVALNDIDASDANTEVSMSNDGNAAIDEGKQIDTIKREIEMLKQTCRHENIVRYISEVPHSPSRYHACYRNQAENSIWIITEFCAAGSIHDCIRLVRTTFSERQISLVMQDALKGTCTPQLYLTLGLGYLHSCGIIHRDIKAANLLLTEAPEVITGTDYGVSADIWSLEMAEGNPPLSSLHPMRAMFKIPFSHAPVLSRANRHTGKFKAFLAACLHMRPESRATCAQLARMEFTKFRPAAGGANPLLEKVGQVIRIRAERRARVEAADATIKAYPRPQNLTLPSAAGSQPADPRVEEEEEDDIDQDSCYDVPASDPEASIHEQDGDAGDLFDPVALGFKADTATSTPSIVHPPPADMAMDETAELRTASPLMHRNLDNANVDTESTDDNIATVKLSQVQGGMNAETGVDAGRDRCYSTSSVDFFGKVSAFEKNSTFKSQTDSKDHALHSFQNTDVASSNDGPEKQHNSPIVEIGLDRGSDDEDPLEVPGKINNSAMIEVELDQSQDSEDESLKVPRILRRMASQEFGKSARESIRDSYVTAVGDLYIDDSDTDSMFPRSECADPLSSEEDQIFLDDTGMFDSLPAYLKKSVRYDWPMYVLSR